MTEAGYSKKLKILSADNWRGNGVRRLRNSPKTLNIGFAHISDTTAGCAASASTMRKGCVKSMKERVCNVTCFGNNCITFTMSAYA